MINAFHGEHAFLSNFYPSPVTWDGVTYPTVEHAFQAAKTHNQEDRLAILTAATPGRAKKLGRKVALRTDWEGIKLSVMRNLLEQKFKEDDLALWLAETDGEELVEGNHWGDTFWGVCGGIGENHLGKLLMGIREGLLE